MKIAVKGMVAVTIAAAGVTLAAQTMTINGAGATFPNPIYSKWFCEYNKLHKDVRDQLPVARIGRPASVSSRTRPCSSAPRTAR